MTHIDEGTIHGWLDGALDATRSREVETHVQHCAQCAAAVAEARGLIAGSSRILNALDDVPADVIPIGSKRAPAIPPVAKRRWRAAPWVTSIAAALILAVVLTRNGEKGATTALKAVGPVDQTRASVAAEVRSSDTVSPQVVAAKAPIPASAEVPQRIAVTGLSARRQRQIGSVVGEGAGGRTAAANSANTASAARDERASDFSAAPPAPPTPTPAALQQVVVTADRAGVREAASDLTGCYTIPIAVPPARALAASAPPGRASANRRATAAPMAAEVAQPINRVYTIAELARAARDSGFVARDAQSDTVLGTWFMIAPDTADVHLKNGLRVRVSRSAREGCPN